MNIHYYLYNSHQGFCLLDYQKFEAGLMSINQIESLRIQRMQNIIIALNMADWGISCLSTECI